MKCKSSCYMTCILAGFCFVCKEVNIDKIKSKMVCEGLESSVWSLEILT